ncbi:MAG: hypothetical protein DRQ89_12450 [Epsilonproteobacteria bacterium]|nr:MAG: hypothetical protein DRQ89_12450 [Campylobacterota bacterium]
MANEDVTLKPIKIGNSRNIKATLRDKVTKAAIDISGDKFYFTVKDSADQEDSDAVVQVSTVAPADATSQAGIVIIPVSAADTASVIPGTYDYDLVWLKLASAPGERDTLQHGTVYFEQAVTRAQT